MLSIFRTLEESASFRPVPCTCEVMVDKIWADHCTKASGGSAV